MENTLKRVGVIGGVRIPFCRNNTAYADVGNFGMSVKVLGSLVERYGLHGEELGEVAMQAGHLRAARRPHGDLVHGDDRLCSEASEDMAVGEVAGAQIIDGLALHQRGQDLLHLVGDLSVAHRRTSLLTSDAHHCCAAIS